jgi:hypothetical protein
VDEPTKNRFLREDLYNTLRWMLEGAIAWQASFENPERTRHQRVLGMFTTLIPGSTLLSKIRMVQPRQIQVAPKA